MFIRIRYSEAPVGSVMTVRNSAMINHLPASLLKNGKRKQKSFAMGIVMPITVSVE